MKNNKINIIYSFLKNNDEEWNYKIKYYNKIYFKIKFLILNKIKLSEP